MRFMSKKKTLFNQSLIVSLLSFYSGLIKMLNRKEKNDKSLSLFVAYACL